MSGSLTGDFLPNGQYAPPELLAALSAQEGPPGAPRMVPHFNPSGGIGGGDLGSGYAPIANALRGVANSPTPAYLSGSGQPATMPGPTGDVPAAIATAPMAPEAPRMVPHFNPSGGIGGGDLGSGYAPIANALRGVANSPTPAYLSGSGQPATMPGPTGDVPAAIANSPSTFGALAALSAQEGPPAPPTYAQNITALRQLSNSPSPAQIQQAQVATATAPMTPGAPRMVPNFNPSGGLGGGDLASGYAPIANALRGVANSPTPPYLAGNGQPRTMPGPTGDVPATIANSPATLGALAALSQARNYASFPSPQPSSTSPTSQSAVTTVPNSVNPDASYAPPMEWAGQAEYQPAPKEYASAVAAASNKYNVPRQILEWQITHESGWNPNARNPDGATGLGQFMPHTWAQYGKGASPTDPMASINATAAYDRDLFNQTGSWTKAIGRYGTFTPVAGGAANPQLVAGFQKMLGNNQIPDGIPQSAASRLKTAQQANNSAQSGPPPLPTKYIAAAQADKDAATMAQPPTASSDPAMPFTIPRATTGDKLLAVSAGLSGAPTLGVGIGRAAGNLVGLREQDMRNQMTGEELGSNLALRNAMLGIEGQRVNAYQQNIANRYNVPLQNALAAGKKEGQVTAQDATDDADEVQNDGMAAPTKLLQLRKLQQLVDSGQFSSGPGVQKFYRDVANALNVPLPNNNPTVNQLGASILSQVRGNGIMGKNMRTQLEFNSVMEGLGTPDLNPGSLKGVINGLINIEQFKGSMWADWQRMVAQNPQLGYQLRTNPDQLNQWIYNELHNWSDRMNAQGGLYAPPGSQAAASLSPAAPPAAAPTGGQTSTGVKWSLNP